MSQHFWLRDEVKEGERRVPLLPNQAKQLLDRGYVVSVEKSVTRCIPDEDYEKIGCTMVPTGTWKSAPANAFILGLKELPEDASLLNHTHIYFAHCFKNQSGWQDLLKRFRDGKGNLLDLEFLVHENGRRVAAFGYSAGFVGMALGIKQWCLQQTEGPNAKLGTLNYYNSSDHLIQDVKNDLDKVRTLNNKTPTVLVIGALGRCGTGAVTLAEKVGLTAISKWDLEETRKGGPFQEILQHDVFVNCIYLSQPIPPFVTREMIDQPRTLNVMVDVSCDTSNPHNPVPIYSQTTTLFHPILKTRPEGDLPLDVIAIDHLPSLVPLESSIEFSEALFPHVLECPNSDVWKRAETLFNQKLQLID